MPSPAELKTVGDDNVVVRCVFDLLIAFSKFLTERHVHIRQQSESAGLSCPKLNLSILHIFKSRI